MVLSHRKSMNGLSLNDELDKLTLPELIELMHKILDLIQLREMEDAE